MCLNRINFWRIAFVILSAGLLILPGARIARADWIPFVHASIEQLYDSNIFLDPDGYHRPGANKSDFRTNISPGIGIRNESQVQTVSAEYVFNYSYFVNNSDQNYAGHTGNFEIERQVAEHLRWYLHDSLSVSEEPRTDRYDYVTVNYGRRRNLTNDGTTGLEYVFGPENSFELHYSDNRLDYLNTSGSRGDIRNRLGEDDSVTYGPGFEFIYWFNIQNGISITYDWERTDYKISPSERRDHLDAGYIYRFSPHTSVQVDFILDYVDTKDPLMFDYKIYQATVGFTKVFNPTWELDIYGGFYYRPSGDVPDELDSSDNEGFSGGMTLTYTQEVWHVTVSGEAGARVEYGDYNNQGYTPYRRISVDFGYTFNPRLSYFSSASYDYEKSPDTGYALMAGEDRRETYDVSVGLNYELLPWLSSRAEYEFSKESATNLEGRLPTGYTDHVFLISLTASYDWL